MVDDGEMMMDMMMPRDTMMAGHVWEGQLTSGALVVTASR